MPRTEDAQAAARREKVNYLVEKFISMATSPELRVKLHEYFWRLDIDPSVQHYSITAGTKPVSDDDIAHVRQALANADEKGLNGLFEIISRIPMPIGMRREAPHARTASTA